MNNNQATIQKMEQMRLYGMVRAFRSTFESGVKNNFTSDELLSHLVDAEWDDQHNRKIERLVRNAGFRYKVIFEEIDFGLNRSLDKNFILRLSDCEWIKNHQNIIITGPTGCGKSFVASALGHQACFHGFKTVYFSTTKLFRNLKLDRMDGTYAKEMKRIQKMDLIILDDFGLEAIDASSRLGLLEILEDRHGIHSLIVISQVPVSGWHEVIGDATIADAICDRIVHSAHRVEMKGESIRKLFSNRS